MAALPLLREETVTLERALSNDDYILHHLDYPQKQKEFWEVLHSHKSDIEALVRFHLRFEHCYVAGEDEWLYGSYNVAIPVYLGNSPSDERVIFRVPLPYKIGEEFNPGNVDEKLRTEIATYIWIRENCPTVPIPTLYGFAFPGGQTFAEPACASLVDRLYWNVDRTLRSSLGLPVSCPFINVGYPSPIKTGYILISYVKTGRMLSMDWKDILHDTARRQTLFKDLAKIMIALNRIKLPRIGSLSIDNSGMIQLNNRPLTLRLQTLEEEGVATIPRDSTYESIELYLLDLLHCHDNRMRCVPNTIHDDVDGLMQCAALTIMRSVMPQFLSREYRGSPFVFTLTDIHASNIFVDNDWHITSLIDLEWACSFPAELQIPPYWITCQTIDHMGEGERLEEFTKAITEFIDIFEEQEKNLQIPHHASQAEVMRRCWEKGSYWYFLALDSPKGLLAVFMDHIQPLFSQEHRSEEAFDRIVAPYWSVGTQEFIEKKVAEDAEYKDRLRKRFGNGSNP